LKKLTILSVNVTGVVYDEIEREISDAIRERKQKVVMYASMYIVNLAQSDVQFRNALLASDIVHPDGIGVWLASKFLYRKGFSDRFNWTDHAYEFLQDCAKQGWSIFFLGSTIEIQRKAEERMKREIPNLKIAGMKNGFEDVESDDLIKSINNAHPNILWVAMGAPKQELWIHEHRHELNCFVIQSVGDAMSLIAGVKKRGPKFLQKVGLEWLVRFFFHPSKFFTRYVIGIPVFIVRVLKQRFAI
jgi:N-acetylglucosaminyldiphosphoundecaprenol N-acetyl-beta-D-mannosaminyltransferase